MGRASGRGQTAAGGQRRGDTASLSMTDRVLAGVRAMGFKEAYAVGGSIRDKLLGRDPKDVDIAVAGHDFEDVLARALEASGGKAAALEIGKQCVGVRMYAPWGENGEPIEVELALARTEVSTGGSRHAFAVQAHRDVTIEQDLDRRDFTVNAMAENIYTGERIDPHGGAADLRAGILRTISEKSFPEDPLRVMRGIARCAKDGLVPEEQTFAQMSEWAADPKRYMRARIGELIAERAQAVTAEAADMRATAAGLPADKQAKALAAADAHVAENPLLQSLRAEGLLREDGTLADEAALHEWGEVAIDDHAHRKGFEDITGYRWYGELPLSPERVRDEFLKTLSGDQAADGLAIARDTGVLAHVVPELADSIGFDQMSKFHDMTVDEHTLLVLKRATELNAPLPVRLAAALHDSGKRASAWGWGYDEDGNERAFDADEWAELPRERKLDGDEHLHFYARPPLKDADDNILIPAGIAHEDIGEANVGTLANRMVLPLEMTSKVKLLVREHMYRDDDDFLSLNAGAQARRARRFLQRVGVDNAEELMLLRRCDRGGKRATPQPGWDEEISAFETRVRQEMEAGAAVSVKDLAVRGQDLMTVGVKGPALGETLKRLLEPVVEQPELNTRENLLAMAEQMRADVDAHVAELARQRAADKAARAEEARAAARAAKAAKAA